MKKTATFCFSLLFFCLLLCGASAQSAETLRGYEKGEGWQYVLLGAYPYEKDGTVRPVLWRVLGIEDGQALLFSEYVLDLQQVILCDNQKESENRTFRRIADFAESDLYAWMNTEMLSSMFEKSVQDALIETHYGKIYPLTREQYMNPEYGFPNAWDGVFKVRQAIATPYATTLQLYPDSPLWGHNKSLYVDPQYGSSPHWVIHFRYDDSETNIMLQLCGYDGHLSYGVYTRRDVGVRPAVTLPLAQFEIAAGTGEKNDPFILKTLSLGE